jgi:hypothetical protein
LSPYIYHEIPRTNDTGESTHRKAAMTTLPVPDLELPQGTTQKDRPRLYLLDYGAGNVRSLANSIHKLGYDFEWVKDASDLEKAEVSPSYRLI